MYYYNTINDTFDRVFDLFNKVHYYGENIKNPEEITNLEIALPGFSKKDINIEIESRTLTISADVSEENETKHFKSFRKVYLLHTNADSKNIKATMINGLLTIDFGNKSEKKSIAIK